LSLKQGAPGKFTDWQASYVDGAGGHSVTERMWQRMRPLAERSVVVTLDETRRAMRLIAEKSRTIAEGAGALSLAAALTGKAQGPIVCVVSGGNIDLAKFAELVAD
jgi:threonine dehydratase